MTKHVVLLIGGDLCRHVAARLAPEHWQTWGLRRHPPADASMRTIQADLAVPASLRDLPRDISHVVYAPSPDAREPTSYQTTYPLGVENLLDALAPATHLKRLVLVGSSVVWPASDAAHAMDWVDETTPACADNFRSAAILQAEKILFDRLPGRGVVLRLGGIYGPGRSRLIEHLRSGQLVSPKGPGHWSNRIHIEDAASACIHLLGLPDPETCYIGTDGHPTKTGEFHAQLADLMGVPRPPSCLRPPSGKRLSNARLVDSGWFPRWPDALVGYRAILNQ